MNKSQLVEQVARDTGLSKSDARRALDSVLATVQWSLERGEDVSLTGFGRFSVVTRSAGMGRNPQTGKAATFTPGAGLKQAVAGRRRTEPSEFEATDSEEPDFAGDENDDAADADIRMLPSRRFARIAPWPPEESWSCELAWKPGYLKSHFRAMAAPPGSRRRRSIGKSSPVRWTLMTDPEPPTPEMVEVVRELAETLLASGWEQTDSVGGPWYALRFIWRGEGQPQRIDALGPKAERNEGQR